MPNLSDFAVFPRLIVTCFKNFDLPRASPELREMLGLTNFVLGSPASNRSAIRAAETWLDGGQRLPPNESHYLDAKPGQQAEELLCNWY